MEAKEKEKIKSLLRDFLIMTDWMSSYEEDKLIKMATLPNQSTITAGFFHNYSETNLELKFSKLKLEKLKHILGTTMIVDMDNIINSISKITTQVMKHSGNCYVSIFFLKADPKMITPQEFGKIMYENQNQIHEIFYEMQENQLVKLFNMYSFHYEQYGIIGGGKPVITKEGFFKPFEDKKRFVESLDFFDRDNNQSYKIKDLFDYDSLPHYLIEER